MGGPPLPPRDPPLGEREKGGRGREAPLAPGGRRGQGKEGGGGWGGTWVRLDREGVCSSPLGGGRGGEGEGGGRK